MVTCILRCLQRKKKKTKKICHNNRLTKTYIAKETCRTTDLFNIMFLCIEKIKFGEVNKVIESVMYLKTRDKLFRYNRNKQSMQCLARIHYINKYFFLFMFQFSLYYFVSNIHILYSPVCSFVYLYYSLQYVGISVRDVYIIILIYYNLPRLLVHHFN